MDALLFIDIICSEGCRLLHEDSEEDLTIGYYHGLTGRKVGIIVNDEELTPTIMKAHLIKLGLPHLVDRMVPASATVGLSAESVTNDEVRLERE